MKKWWIFVLVIAVAAAGAGVLLGWPEPAVTVDTVTLTPRQVELTVSCNGVVESAENTGVFASMPCVISRVSVTQGQRVKKGDVLAVVDKEATRTHATGAAAVMALAAMSEELVAPDDGIVVAVKANPGQLLELGTPCAVLALYSDLQVRISIREKDLPALQTGMAARITGDGFERDRYEGKLSDISSAARTSAGVGTVVEGIVTLQPEPMDRSLRLGLTAKATIVTSVIDNGLVIPYEAIFTQGKQSYVYRLEEGCAQRQGIRIKAHLSEGALLTDGELNGAVIVAQPEKIDRDGQVVVAAGEDDQ